MRVIGNFFKNSLADITQSALLWTSSCRFHVDGNSVADFIKSAIS